MTLEQEKMNIKARIQENINRMEHTLSLNCFVGHKQVLESQIVSAKNELLASYLN